MKQKGVVNTLIIILVLVTITGIAGYFVFVKKFPTKPPTTTNQTVVNDFEKLVIPESQKQSPIKNGVRSHDDGVSLYRGSWFDIEYPKGFATRPKEPTHTFNGNTFVETDEAYFLSSDGAVEFFVFSPLWRGDPDYMSMSPTEELLSEKTDESGAGLNKKVIRWVTLKAQDGSYYRSYVSIKDQVDTESDLHHVFGFKYQDNAAYKHYRDAYNSFKNSLRQYGD